MGGRGRVLAMEPDDVILTPIRVEFLGGTRDRNELRLADIFLRCFVVLDGGRVLPEDLVVAERYARRVRFGGRSRGAIDCLIVAMRKRLRAEIRSGDTGIPG